MKEPLDDILSHPRIWRGRHAPRAIQTVPTGHPSLDGVLPGGGWPRSGLIEILVERWGTGEVRLIVPLLRHFSGQHTAVPHDRGWIAWIGPPYVPYAPALADAGVDVNRILLVHARDDREALWAIEQALRSTGCEVVLGWAERSDNASLRRLQLAAEDNGLPVILFRPVRALDNPSPAALRLHLPAGADACLAVVKGRGGRPAGFPVRDLFDRVDA